MVEVVAVLYCDGLVRNNNRNNRVLVLVDKRELIQQLGKRRLRPREILVAARLIFGAIVTGWLI